MDDTYNERRTAFLSELTLLTRKYRIAVGGCGCCGSPSLDDLDPDKIGPEMGYSEKDRYCEIHWEKL